MKIHIVWLATVHVALFLGFYVNMPRLIWVQYGEFLIPTCGQETGYPCVEIAAVNFGDL